MTSTAFTTRVQSLRGSWIERREIHRLAGSHDFDSQLRLLHTLYDWAAVCADDINDIYGSPTTATLSPPPVTSCPAFSVVVADCQTVSFTLVRGTAFGGPHWFVAARIGGVAGNDAPVPVGPGRRDGHWSRGRLEDLLLSVLGAYERLVAEAEPQARRAV